MICSYGFMTVRIKQLFLAACWVSQFRDFADTVFLRKKKIKKRNQEGFKYLCWSTLQHDGSIVMLGIKAVALQDGKISLIPAFCHQHQLFTFLKHFKAHGGCYLFFYEAPKPECGLIKCLRDRMSVCLGCWDVYKDRHTYIHRYTVHRCVVLIVNGLHIA